MKAHLSRTALLISLVLGASSGCAPAPAAPSTLAAPVDLIAQLGANTAASLDNRGGPKLQGLADKINQITVQIARGQFQTALSGLGEFEQLLGGRPGGQPGGAYPGPGSGGPLRRP